MPIMTKWKFKTIQVQIQSFSCNVQQSDQGVTRERINTEILSVRPSISSEESF